MTTLRERILLSAVDLDASGLFAVEDLIVACWRKFPESFSLKGHAEHADSNKVMAKVHGTHGVRALGWIERTDDGRLSITRKGKTVAAQLAAGRGSTDPTPEEVREVFERVKTVRGTAKALGRSKSGTRDMLERQGLRDRVAATPPAQEKPAVNGSEPLTEAEFARLQTLARHATSKKFLRGSPLRAEDAMSFWGVKSNDRQAVKDKVAQVGEFLERVVAVIRNSGWPTPSPSISTCYALLNTHRVMESKFASPGASHG